MVTATFSVMQLTYQKLPAQLRRSSRFRKVMAVLLAAYTVRKLSPYVWRRIQVRQHLRRPTDTHTETLYVNVGVFVLLTEECSR